MFRLFQFEFVASAKSDSAGNVLPIRCDLEETSGRIQEINRTQLMMLALHKPGGGIVQAQYEAIKILDGAENEVPETWSVRPRAIVPVIVRISGLDEPGTYNGTFRLTAPDADAVEQVVTIAIRKGWGVAALLIGIGALVSYLLRTYLKATERALRSSRRLRASLLDFDSFGQETFNNDW